MASSLPHLKLPRMTPTRASRAALAVVVVGSVVSVGFGTGYRTSQSAFGDGSAYLQKGSGVLHVQQQSRDVDAETAAKLATGKETLEVVQTGPDSVYVVNNDTQVVTRLPTDTLVPEPVAAGRSNTKGQRRVVAGGGKSYLLDTYNRTLQELGSKGEAPAETQITQVVVDSAGTAWALSAAGELQEISGHRVAGHQQVSTPAEDVKLTLVSDSPVLYRVSSGDAGLYGHDGLRRQLSLGVRGGVVSAPGSAEAVVAVLEPRTGTLVTGDFNTGAIVRLTLPGDRAGHRFGAPVVQHGHVYVPDFTGRHVLVVSLGGQLRVQSVNPVAGTTYEFQMTVRDDCVWVNDPYDRIVLAFDASGKPTEIDVGDGDGVADKPLNTPSPRATPSRPQDTLPTAQPRTRTTTGPQPTKTLAPSPKPAQRYVTMPDLAGVERHEACQQLKAQRLRCTTVARPEGEGETDHVISTDPAAGAKVREGETVQVTYRGPVTVPSVAGMPAERACQTLAAAQLGCLERPEGLAKTSAEVKVVTRQSPAADTPASTGVQVTVAYPVQVAVGSFAGQSVDNACAAVQQAQLICVKQDLGPGTPAFVVQGQTPQAGAGIDPGGTVTLTHFSNATVPNVANMTPDQACAAIQAVKLTCNPSDNEATLDVGRVHAQDPQPGGQLPAGNAVTYTFESTAPVLLNRFKIPAPGRSNFLSPGGGGPGGWSTQSVIGRVYPAAGGVPGLVPIYQFRCANSNACEAGGYYFSPNANAPANYAGEGAAFSCFPNNVQGTIPLQGLFHDQAKTWVWATPGTGEYTTFLSGGFRDTGFTICYVWPRP